MPSLYDDTLRLSRSDALANLVEVSSQAPPPALVTKGLDPFATKITAVLSTSFSDAEFREALRLLDSKPIQNNAESRRQLRSDLVKEAIEFNGEVVREFGMIAQKLRRIETIIGQLNMQYKMMKSQLDIAYFQTTSALAEASSILQEQQDIASKRDILTALTNHFIMTDTEISTLTSAMEPVDSFFFNSLRRAKTITQDCELLLGFETQTLGMEFIERASRNIDLGFQKLYKWVQRELKNLNMDNPQMNHSMRHALLVLAERPSLFQNCLGLFAEARERILSDAFHCALTGITSGGAADMNVKPIDLTAHDPLRYVGDMLAWVHSAAVSEREVLEILFVDNGEVASKGSQANETAKFWMLLPDEADYESGLSALDALNNLVDRNVSGAARLLRQRVEQVVQLNEDIVLAYKIAALISFYHFTFQKLVGVESGLSECVESLEVEAMRQFRALLRDNAAAVQGESYPLSSSLEHPEFLQKALKQLSAIHGVYTSSIFSSEDRCLEFQDLLTDALNPFLSRCEEIAQSMERPNNNIFLLNCRIATIKCLQSFNFTSHQVKLIQDELDKNISDLIDEQYDLFRQGSGLCSLIDSVHSNLPDIRRDMLSKASQDLDDFLPTALMDAMDRLNGIQDQELAHSITEKGAEKFCRDFERVEQTIIHIDGTAGVEAIESLRLLFPRTASEIRVLLS